MTVTRVKCLAGREPISGAPVAAVRCARKRMVHGCAACAIGAGGGCKHDLYTKT